MPIYITLPVFVYLISILLTYLLLSWYHRMKPGSDFFNDRGVVLFTIYCPVWNTIIWIGFIVIIIQYDFKKILSTMINYIRRLFGYYDSYGVKYSSRHLDRVEKLIPFWNIHHQAEYVDRVCKENVNAPWLKKQFTSINPATLFTLNWTTTSVGNCAYVALHCDDEAIRKIALACLDNLKNHLIQQGGMNKK